MSLPDPGRRRVLRGSAAVALGAVMPGRLALAAADTGQRLLLVILRGALDGLAAVPPYGDRHYRAARGALALPENSDAMLDLDGRFGLHAALAPLAQRYRAGELLVLHAASTPYRDRSHFDAQDLLESGGARPHALDDGWLARTLAALGNDTPAIAIGASVPLVLRGPAAVTSWAPSVLPAVDEDLLARVMHMYEDDQLLRDALAEASRPAMDGERPRGPRAVVATMRQAARFMNDTGTARVGALDMGGWDTHANQGRESGRLAGNLGLLAEALEAYREGMGGAWARSVVLVVTEFGRTVAANGSGGSDHGTGGVTMVLGGAVAGGRVIGEWPGLGNLYQGRDLAPANDLRALLGGVLVEHLGVAPGTVTGTVFPGLQGVTRGLVRA